MPPNFEKDLKGCVALGSSVRASVCLSVTTLRYGFEIS